MNMDWDDTALLKAYDQAVRKGDKAKSSGSAAKQSPASQEARKQAAEPRKKLRVVPGPPKLEDAQPILQHSQVHLEELLNSYFQAGYALGRYHAETRQDEDGDE